MSESQEELLDQLYAEYQEDPQFRYLREDHPNTFFVPGDGPMSPNIMLVGEAPGRLENAKRMPFVGKAGTNLTNILTDLHIDPFKVFMTNVIKYWPQDTPGHTRNPDPDEIEAHRLYLLKEINIVQPKIVGLCGYSAITAIYPKIKRVYDVHGSLFDNKFVPLYHPAGATWDRSKKPLIVSGYAKLRDYVGELSGNASSTEGARQ